MGVDAIAKRYFPLIVCVLLAVIALFQARGIGALIAGQLPAGSPPPKSAVSGNGPAHERTPKIKSVTAQPILARNAFDSKTGPLDKIAPPPPQPEPTTPQPTDPEAAAEDPACPTGSVVLIADSEDPAWSFAMIRTSSGAKMRRVGDDVDGQTVKAITWDRVWLASGTGRCQLKLDIAANKTAAATPTPPAQPTTAPTAAPPKDQVDPSAIRKVSENEYVVQRSVMDKANGFAAELKKGSRLVPGKGIRVPRIDPGTLLSQIGLTGGDIVRTINGFDMTDLDKTAEGYSRLKSAREITLGLERNGQPVTVTLKIE